jgi:hypothetical protein
MKTMGLAWISLGAFAAALSLVGCSDSGDNGTGGTGGSGGPTVSVGGIAWGFTLPGQGGTTSSPTPRSPSSRRRS